MTTKEILIRVLTLIRPYRLRLAASMVCMVGVAGLSGLQAYMVKPVLDEIFFNKDQVMLNLVPLALIGVFLAKGICYFSYSFLLHFVGQSVVRDLRISIYRHLQNLPLAFFHNTPTGELISRIVNDVTQVQGAVSQALVGILKDAVQAVCLVGVIFYMDWKLALMSFIFLPVSFFPIVHFGRRHRLYSLQNQQTTALVSNVVFEAVTGNRIVKAFCMEGYEIGRFREMVDRLFGIILKDMRIKSVSHPIMELVGGVGVALIMWYGGSQVLAGKSTPGAFFSFLTSLLMVYEPIKGVSGTNSTVQNGIAAAARIFSVLDIRSDIVESEAAVAIPPIRDYLAFRDVSFSYDGRRTVLKNVSLTVEAGEVVAIVGSSGSGKSTLVDLIPRFFDVTEGAIILDGRDIREATLASLRGQIGIVTQQTILFNDTIRANIAYGDHARSEEELKAAARAAHALDFIERLPEGFDTVIGEHGVKLSGGERQRISIARAILKNAPILILDEATSALDNESERVVQKALDNLMANRTTFVIAHRLSTVRNADRILVMQEGRIVEEGSHEELLARAGTYRLLHDMQY